MDRYTRCRSSLTIAPPVTATRLVSRPVLILYSISVHMMESVLKYHAQLVYRGLIDL
jgi:hypothetical protein